MTIHDAVELAPAQYQDPLLRVIERFSITNPTEFLATVYYESSYLTRLTENLNYSSDALLKKFSRKRISYQDALRFGRTNIKPAYPEAIANCIYGGEYGRRELGNYLPGDGWHYRGQGPIQLTGRANWEAFAAFMGRPEFAEDPSKALADPFYACASSGWFWAQLKRINACGSDMRAVTKRVTGAADTAIKTRTQYRDRIKALVEAP